MSYLKVLTVAVVYGGISLASATTLNLFNSLTTQGQLANSVNLTFPDDYGTGSVTATGYLQNLNPSGQTPLYYKIGGGDETGLGMAADTVDHEIGGTRFIQLDFSSLLSQYAGHSPFSIVSASITIGSVQNGESFRIFGSNTAGTEGTQIGATGTADGSVTLTLAQLNANHFISILAPGGNVLIDAASVTTSNGGQVSTPEPATSALMGSGLLGALFLIRRRRAAKV
jgi:hypothetical protein